jgi:hypothetical protein
MPQMSTKGIRSATCHCHAWRQQLYQWKKILNPSRRTPAIILCIAILCIHSLWRLDDHVSTPPPQTFFTNSEILDNTTTCTFAYPGPLRSASLSCFLEYFPNSAPLSYPASLASSWQTLPAGQRRFATLNGIRWEEGPPPVPIFIIFKDRVSVLLETLRNLYRYLRTPFEVVIIHDMSTYPVAVQFIDRLKDSGILVYETTRPWTDFDEFYQIIADLVAHYMQYAASSYYVLTDPDCALDSAPWNLLLVYQTIMDELEVDVVGAALRWDDFPESLAGANYEEKIARLPAQTFTYQERSYYYIDAQVDTTFAMYRKGPRLQRFAGKHIRMLPPLGVRHLDFYLEKNRLPPDYVEYHKAARRGDVNHMVHLD